MRVRTLRIKNLRCLADVEVAPGERFNVLIGGNGAGKTTILEAIYLLSRARSFRKGPPVTLVRHATSRLDVYGEVADLQRGRRIGLAYADGRWQAKLDGESVDRLGDLVEACPVVYFGPESHGLVIGAAEERRRFLDWGVFHVEHEFLSHWKRYRKALRQRNAILRMQQLPEAAAIVPWEREMAVAAEAIALMRGEYLRRLETRVRVVAAELQPELGELSLRYARGWASGRELLEVLALQREKDHLRGYTSLGIHRADWQPVFEHASERVYLSRGQQKACSFALQLAQAQLYTEDHGEWPVMCMDDLIAELDPGHREAVIATLAEQDMQVFLTGTETGMALPPGVPCQTFHVEHGTLTCTGNH